MQFKIWIDDDNYVTVACEFQSNRSGGYEDGPEIIAATIVDKKLSNIEIDQLLDLAGGAVDLLTAKPAVATSPQEDWRDKFRRREL